MKLEAAWVSAPATQAIFDALEAQGHAAFVVGGAVRDAAFGRATSDIDIATDALPKDVIKAAAALGLKTVPTGLEHGTVTVLSDGIPHEVTTFRRDVETDGRHAVVAFGGSVESDATRRDFTINALYATRDGHVLDPVNGLPDIAARRVRFVGEAAARIEEDALRILRFFRFYAWFGTPQEGPDPDALAAIAAGLDGLEKVSAERVHQELKKLLSAPDPAPSVAAMAATGTLLRVVPGAQTEALAPLVHLEEDRAPRWLRRLAVLGGDVSELRLSNREKRTLDAYVQAMNLPTSEAAWRFGLNSAEDAALILAASTQMPLAPDLVAKLTLGANAIFPLKGADLMEFLQPGPAIGKALKRAEQHWIASDFTKTKQELITYLSFA